MRVLIQDRRDGFILPPLFFSRLHVKSKGVHVSHGKLAEQERKTKLSRRAVDTHTLSTELDRE